MCINNQKFCSGEILRWLVCGGVTLHTILRIGLIYCFGMFLAQFKLQYQSSMGLLTWIGSLSISLASILAPIPAIVRSKIKTNGNMKISIVSTIVLSICCFISSFLEPPWLILTIGVVYGVALCFAYLSASMVLMEFFPRNHKHHILASTFLYSGYPLASLIYNPLSNFIISSFSWQNCFRLIGLALLIFGIPIATIFKDNIDYINPEVGDNKLNELEILKKDKEKLINEPTNKQIYQSIERKDKLENKVERFGKTLNVEEEKKNNENKNEKIVKEKNENKIKQGMEIEGLMDLLTESLRRPEIWCWWMASLISHILYYVPFFTLPHYMKKNKLEEEKVSLVMVVMSLGEWIIYMLVAFLGKYLEGRLVLASIFSSALISILYFVWIFVDFSFSVCISFSLVYGSMIGVNSVFCYTCSAEVTHLPLVEAWSSTNFFSGLGTLVAPLVTGVIYDIRNNYNDMFLCLTISALFSTIFYLLSAIFSHMTKKKLISNQP